MLPQDISMINKFSCCDILTSVIMGSGGGPSRSGF